MQGDGDTNTKLMIIGEAPGQNEDKEGMPFIGQSGKTVNGILSELGIDRSSIYLTNAVKCAWPEENQKPSDSVITKCKAHLNKEINSINPYVILTLGAVPMYAVLGKKGIAKFKNHVYVRDDGIKVIPTFHPAHALRNPDAIHAIRDGFELAIKETKKREVMTKATTKTKYMLADTDKKIIKVFKKLKTKKEFAMDVETSSLSFLTANIISIQFSWAVGLGITVPWEPIAKSEKLSRMLKEILASDQTKIGQNIKFDIQMLLAAGFETKGRLFDTHVAHSLIDDNSVDHTLETLVLHYTDMGPYWEDLDKFKKEYIKEHKIDKDDFSYGLIPFEILWQYGAKDADATYRLKKLFVPLLKKEKTYKFFKKYSMPFLPVLIEMEYRGIKVDRDRLNDLIGEWQLLVEQKEKEIRKDSIVKKYEKYRSKLNKKKHVKKLKERWKSSEMQQKRFPDFKDYWEKYRKEKEIIHTFNMGSTQQLQQLFFDMLGLRPIKMTKSKKDPKPSTDAEVMEILAEEHNIGLAQLIDDHRKLTKRLDTFLLPMYNKSETDGRIHTSYIQADVVTGRLSSRNPNLQNLEKDFIELRSCFLADDGYVLLKADLGQAEFRVWAACSNDEDMIRDIEAGLDIHKRTASEVFGVSQDEVTKHQRDAAKRGTFGMMYGIGPKTLAHRFKISLDQAKAITTIFSGRYPVAATWIRGQVDYARSHGYVKSWMGRIRRLPHIYADDHNTVAQAERQAMNSPIQAAASDMNNHYMVQICDQGRAKNLDFYPAMTTHDENAFQVRPQHMNQLADVMQHVIDTEFPDFGCKMVLDFKSGPNLGEAKEIEIEEAA